VALGFAAVRTAGLGVGRATLGSLPTVFPGSFAGSGREVGATPTSASAGTPPRTLSPATLDTPRVRRRALWRGEAGLPDRSVLVDWFPISQLGSEQAAADRVRSLSHVHLLSLIAIGASDARTAYAISEASEGVDLATVSRAAPGELPPWWSVQVIASLSRAVSYLVEQQSRRRLAALGHGRINASIIFIGWNGRVQLLAFAPAAGSSRHDETVAPELRLSDRLLSPAADVYALAMLLRQLLPPSALARPGCSRLLRRALHRQSEQRLSLAALHSGLMALSFELAAPHARVAALGDVVGRFCPPARVDLLETDWGESTGDGLAALPPSLAPFATAPVSLSPTWYRRPSPSPARKKTPLAYWLGGVAGLGLLALGGLWLGHSQAGDSGVQSLQPTQQPVAGAGEREPGLAVSIGDALSPRPEPSLAPARTVELASFAGLRVALTWLAGGTEARAASPGIRALVRLSNPGHAVIAADLRQLAVTGKGGVVLRPQPPTGLSGPPVITVGPGRQVSRTLSFAPEVGDTAAAKDGPAAAGATAHSPPSAAQSEPIQPR
jgi:hypothetical protein